VPADSEKSAAPIVCTAQFAVASGSYLGGCRVDLSDIPAAFEAAGATIALALLFVPYALMRPETM
jgi:predicted MFS family arabinose efflux permease